MSKKFESLEAALYQRELDSLIASLTPHINAIRELLIGSMNIHDEEGRLAKEAEVDEVAKWVHEIPQFGKTYYSGYFLTIGMPHPAHIPDFIVRRIKRNAIEKHLAAVDSIAEVQQIAEQAMHEVSQ